MSPGEPGADRWRLRLLLGAALLAAVGGLALPPAARATHAPDHRFLVIGVVADAAGQPRAGVPVAVTRLKTGLVHRTETDASGTYLVVLHLHDEDEGERLGVSVDGVAGEVIARFDVRDARVERGTRVDLRGRRLVEDRPAFARTLREYLAR